MLLSALLPDLLGGAESISVVDASLTNGSEISDAPGFSLEVTGSEDTVLELWLWCAGEPVSTGGSNVVRLKFGNLGVSIVGTGYTEGGVGFPIDAWRLPQGRHGAEVVLEYGLSRLTWYGVVQVN